MKRIQLFFIFVLGLMIPSIGDTQISIAANAQSDNSHPYIEGYEYLWDIEVVVASRSDFDGSWIERSYPYSRKRCSLYGKAFGNKVFYVLYDKSTNKIYRIERDIFYVKEDVLLNKYYKCDSRVVVSTYPISEAYFFSIGD